MKDEFDGFIGYGEGIRQRRRRYFRRFREGISSDERPDL